MLADEEKAGIIFLPLDWEQSITAIISCVATALAVILGRCYKIHEKLIGRLIFTIFIADFVMDATRTSGLIIQPPDTSYCKFIVAVSHTALLLSVSWRVTFGYALYVFAKTRSIDALYRAIKTSTLLCAVFSLIIGIATVFTNYVEYSDNEKTCVHMLTKRDPLVVLFMVLPTATCCIVSVSWYCLTAGVVRRKQIDMNANELTYLLLYPAIVIVCWSPILFLDFYRSLDHEPSDVVQTIFKNILQLQGLLDALVYAWSLNLCSKRNKSRNKKGKDRLLESDEEEVTRRSSNKVVHKELVREDPDDFIKDPKFSF